MQRTDVGVGMIMIQMGIRADQGNRRCGGAVRVVRKRREVPCEIRVRWLAERKKIAAGTAMTEQNGAE